MLFKMKTVRLHLVFLLLLLIIRGTGSVSAQQLPGVASEDAQYIRENFTKLERLIPMRDGKKLFTSIYVPKDRSRKYPILLSRTPYSELLTARINTKPRWGLRRSLSGKDTFLSIRTCADGGCPRANLRTSGPT